MCEAHTVVHNYVAHNPVKRHTHLTFGDTGGSRIESVGVAAAAVIEEHLASALVRVEVVEQVRLGARLAQLALSALVGVRRALERDGRRRQALDRVVLLMHGQVLCGSCRFLKSSE